jgi:SAM-dependent methyltransferase
MSKLGEQHIRLKLPVWDSDRFAVPADIELFDRLTEELRVHSQGADNGPWTRLPDDEVRGTIEQMLAGWCGWFRFPLTESREIADLFCSTEVLRDYETFLRGIDHVGILDGKSLNDLAATNWRLLDLGSLMDFLLISGFFEFEGHRPKILEIGGGFGRLAEFLPLITGVFMEYVIIDVAPVSLMYAHQYLTLRFPERRTVMFSPGVALDDYDFLIVPSWYAEYLPRNYFDLAINVESMQEMNQDLVDYYVEYIHAHVRDQGVIYLVNSREHLFTGSWNFPSEWECLYRHRTIRSWTLNHPAEIFRKTASSHKRANMLRTAALERELDLHRAVQKLRFSHAARLSYTLHQPFSIRKVLTIPYLLGLLLVPQPVKRNIKVTMERARAYWAGK